MTPFKRTLLLIALLSLLLTTGCAYKNHIKQGDALYAQGNYEAALTQYEAALERRPKSEDARRRLEDAQNALIAQLSAETYALLDEKNHPAALDAAIALENRLPNFPAVQALLRDVSGRIQADAESASQRSEWARALDLYMLTYDAFPEDRATLDPRIQSVKSTWHAELTQAAQNAETLGNQGDALLLHAQAAQLLLKPQNVAKRDELHARLLSESIYPCSLRGRGEIYDHVSSQLTGLGGLSQNIQFIKSAKSSTPIAAELTISSGRTKFRTDRSTLTRTKDYVSGTRQVENPSYANRQRELEREERDLYRYEDDLMQAERDVDRYADQVAREGDTPGVSTGAEQSLSRARSDLERARDHVERARDRVRRATEQLRDTPPTIEEDVYSTLEYNVTTHTRTAYVSLEFVVRHEDEAREDISIPITPSVSASDEEHRAYPIADVPEDPLDLPPDATLESQLYTIAVNEAFHAADQSFQAHRQKLLAEAFAETDLGKRLHLYVVYIITDPANVDQRVLDEIYSVRGIPNAHDLLMQTNLVGK